MFGFTNFTGLAFVGKVGTFGLEFTVGLVEEVTFNVTVIAAADAVEISENMNVKLISKDQFIVTAAAGIGSRIGQSKLFDLIVSATPNLFI